MKKMARIIAIVPVIVVTLWCTVLATRGAALSPGIDLSAYVSSQSNYDKIFANAKAAASAELKNFTQAASQGPAANARNKYRSAMEALEILCALSEKSRKQFQGQCKSLPKALGSTLEEKYGSLKTHTEGSEAIQAKINGNTMTIDIYVNFRGDYNRKLEGQTYASLAKKGFKLWQGSYKGDKHSFQSDMRFNVKVRIFDIYNGANAKQGQNYFDFLCISANGRSYTNFGAGLWSRACLGTRKGAIYNKNHTNGAILMYNCYKGKNYSLNQYVKVAAHEFGHVIGIGDAYDKGLKSTAEVPSGKFYISGDIMGTHGKVTPNNIEMMLEAYRTGIYQAFVTAGYEVKSKVIRSY